MAGFATGLTVIGVAAALYIVSQARALEQTLPPVRMDLAAELPTSTFIYAADGSELAQIGLENRVWASLGDISPHVIDALLATEDRRFFAHDGVDYKRLMTAGWAAVRGKDAGGASTLTMQLVRNVYPEIGQLPRRERKVRELLMAQRIEEVYTKRELLELYLNKMSFGRGAFGIEAAAETYFSRPARDLDLLEAALLIGLLKGPSYYDPVQHPKRAMARRRVVLLSLVAAEKLTEPVMNQLSSERLGLHLAPRRALSGTAPHFTEYVRREVEAWGRASGFDIYRDGLRIHTTLDPYMQRLAASVVARRADELQDIAGRDWAAAGQPFGAFWQQNTLFEEQQIRKTDRFGRLRARGTAPGMASYQLRSDPAFMDSLRASSTRLEAGLVAVNPRTGEVKAWVGARDFSIDQYDKVASARRQPGSTFKPILYAAALEAGYTPHHYAQDVITTYYVPPQGTEWRPTNAGGGATGRLFTLGQALAKSKNTVSARLIQQIGPRRVVDMAERLGVTSELLAVPSIALGTSEVTLKEMVSAYGTFVAEGMHYTSRVVSRIEDADGRLVAQFGPTGNRAMASLHAYTVVNMLRDVTAPGGTGAGLAAQFPIAGDWAGKTGTTQDNTDGWFVAIHPELVAGAWVGFNQPAVRFRSNYYGQGANNAGVVVADFLQTVVDDPMSGVGPAFFTPPSGYVPPRPPADPFAGNLVDEARRFTYYEMDDPALTEGTPGAEALNREQPARVPPAAFQGPRPAPDRASTSRKRMVW